GSLSWAGGPSASDVHSCGAGVCGGLLSKNREGSSSWGPLRSWRPGGRCSSVRVGGLPFSRRDMGPQAFLDFNAGRDPPFWEYGERFLVDVGIFFKPPRLVGRIRTKSCCLRDVE